MDKRHSNLLPGTRIATGMNPPTLKLKKRMQKKGISNAEINRVSTIEDDITRQIAIEFQIQKAEFRRRENEALAILLLI